jgi:hypothetical protein
LSKSVSELSNFFKQQQDSLVETDQRIQTGLSKTVMSRRLRLSTGELIAAGCDNSKNVVLQNLWLAVSDYNNEWIHPTKMSDPQMTRAVAILDYIYQTCATYMTDKSMKTLNSKGGPAKRVARYNAFTKLVGEITKEIDSLGGKLLTGPLDFQENKRNYWLERLDPDHRAGYLISAKYNAWVQSGSTQSFWAWLDANGGYPLKSQSHVEGYGNVNGAQWEHCRYFDNGVLLNSTDDMPFCTQAMKTEFSANGWAVWVCSLPMQSPGGAIGVYVFSYTHRAGFDHHSSFLGGAPVVAAGEWIVNSSGKIRVITGKSGHNMPKWQNLHKFVLRFPEIPGDAIIRPNMLDHNNGTDKIKFYTVTDFRSRELRATPLRRNVVMTAIMATGANANITEHFTGGTATLSSLLPA